MEAIREIEHAYRKPALPQVQSGDTVRVHQLIREGNKQRVQVFEGVVIRTHRLSELTACITVRRIASGVGVEKTFLLHSPNVSKVEVMRRAKVRRNYLSYLRDRRGKSARLKEISFDRAAANVAPVTATAASDPLVDDEVVAEEEVVTEIDPLSEEDALNDALPLDVEVKDEEKAAAAEDDITPTKDPDVGDENVLSEEEVESGINKAEKDLDKAAEKEA